MKNEVLIKKVLYKSEYRGTREADNLLGGFCCALVTSSLVPLNSYNLNKLADFLELNDHDVLSMVAGTKPINQDYSNILNAIIVYKTSGEIVGFE